METQHEVWDIARRAALRVDFITNGRELYLYTRAIYSAMVWGWSQNIAERELIKKSNNLKTMKL